MRATVKLPFLAALLAATMANAAPSRIVSLNSCADPLLLALADKAQVAALTFNARDPSFSVYADKARSWPIARGSAEEALALKPDLIVTGPYLRKETLALIRGRGVPVIEVPPANSYADIVDQVRRVAAAIDRPQRGEALVRRMDAELAAIRPIAGGMVAAHYQRGGYLTGSGTLVDEMMRRVGLSNLAVKLGRPAISHLPLEAMVRARPDILIIGSYSSSGRGADMLLHPALAKAVPPSRRIRLPGAMTVCGGPFYPQAVRMLRDQLAAIGTRTASHGQKPARMPTNAPRPGVR